MQNYWELRRKVDSNEVYAVQCLSSSMSIISVRRKNITTNDKKLL